LLLAGATATASGAPAPRSSLPRLTPVEYNETLRQGCPGRGDFVLPPRVDASTATIWAVPSARANGCFGVFTFASAVGSFGFEGPRFSVPATGDYSARFGWTVSGDYQLRADGVGASTSSLVWIFALDYLIDETNGTYVTGPSGNSAPLFEEIHSGARSGALDAFTFVLYVNATLVAGHEYRFESILTTGAEVIAQSTGSGFAYLGLGLDNAGAVFESYSVAPD
jgi:hypothetical protein